MEENKENIENLINEDIQIVIKSSSEQIVEKNIVNVDLLLQDDYISFLQIFDRPNVKAKEIIQELFIHETLNVLSKYYDYCVFINKAYQGIPILSVEQYPSEFPHIEQINNLSRIEKDSKINEILENQIKQLYRDLKNRLIAFRLEKMYEKYELNPAILSYSHRRRGWSIPKYNLTDNFSFELKTNFGYGSSSYFYTKIQYKEIDVLPYSDWITYEYSNLFEIISASSKYYLQQEEWHTAFDYVIDACRLASTNEQKFVEKYIIEECEKLVSGLHEFLINDTFKFTNNDRVFTDQYKQGENIIEIKGNKVSGSLDFISCIFKFKEIIDVSQFIVRIISFNETIEPILKHEVSLVLDQLALIIEEFNICSNKLKYIEPQYLEYSKKLNTFIFAKSKIALTLIPIEQKSEIERSFALENPSFVQIKKEFDELSQLRLKLSKRRTSLDTTLANMNNYINKINLFIRNEKLKYQT